MGENEQGGMLRTVVVVGIVAMISAIMIFAVVGLTHVSKSQSADVVKNLQTAQDGECDVQDDYDTSKFKYYTFDEAAKTVEIGGYKNKADGKGADLVIPATVKKDGVVYRVTSIGSYAFYNTGLKSVVISNSVTQIEYSAFNDNQLNKVTFGDKLTTIGGSSFYGNQLTSLTIPDTVTTIEGFAFSNNNLTSVKLSRFLTTIPGRAFNNNNLTSLDIPGNIQTIDESAFSGNSNLKTVTLHPGLQSIGANAFAFTSLRSITLPDHNVKLDPDASFINGGPTIKFNYAS